MTRPRLLDLFCGAGGAGMGYALAGFEVVGVDIKRQPDYPFEFYQADALTFPLDGFDVVHASPPCQFATRARLVGAGPNETKTKRTPRVNLIPETRNRLEAYGKPYVIENVEGAAAHLVNPLLLCGSSFDHLRLERDGVTYQLRRHRLFESNVLLMGLPCKHVGPVLGVYHAMGDQVKGVDHATGRQVKGGRTVDTLAEGQALMGIDWMGWRQLREAIPPAYTFWLGEQLRANL